MVAAAHSWGYEPADDNEADAIALWHYRQTEKPENLVQLCS